MFGMWCAMSAIKIIDPIFLRAQMLTDMSHIHSHHFWTLVWWWENVQYEFSQQKNTRAHSANSSMRSDTAFGYISKQQIIDPSFSRSDSVHFFRACVWNDKMYSNISSTEVDLNEKIQDVMSPISPAELRLAMNVFFKCDVCLRASGKHLQHLL